MKYCILYLIYFGFFGIQTHGDKFELFLRSFKHIEPETRVFRSTNSIDFNLFKSVVGDQEYLPPIKVLIYPVGILYESQDKIILLIEYGYPEGGSSSEYNLFEFSRDGSIFDSSPIGYSFLDSDGGEKCYLNLVNDSILEVSKINFLFDNGVKEVIRESFDYFILSENGYKLVNIGRSSRNREFLVVSEKILDREELSDLSKENLDIMRNEIFADHGYKFQTKKWQDYFSNKEWYEPRYDDVNDKLSVIEKINVQTILSVSKTKK